MNNKNIFEVMGRELRVAIIPFKQLCFHSRPAWVTPNTQRGNSDPLCRRKTQGSARNILTYNVTHRIVKLHLFLGTDINDTWSQSGDCLLSRKINLLQHTRTFDRVKHNVLMECQVKLHYAD